MEGVVTQRRSSSLARYVLAAAAPALLFLLTLALYLSTLTEVHTFDALSYVLDVDRKPWQELFHPHHLAYGPLGALVRRLAHALGWVGSAKTPLQVTNALAGALGVALFFALVRAVTRRGALALGAALLLAGSYAYWYYAVEVEVYTIAALFLVLCLGLMVRLLRHPSRWGWAGLGAAQGVAVLFHQTNALLCLPVAVVLLCSAAPQAPRAERRTAAGMIRSLLWYAAPLGLIVGGSYLAVGFGVSGFRSWDELLAWMTGYARTGWWGGPITGAKWADLGAGLADTLAQPGGALLGLLLLGLLLFSARRLFAARRRLTLVLLTWLLIYGAFFLWWEPDNIEFWIASLPPALLLLAIALDTGGSRAQPGMWALLAIGATALALNHAAITQRGTAAYDLQRRIASALAQQSAPDDLLIVPDGLQELYLPYYEGRTNPLSLNHALFEQGNAWPAACAQVQGRIDAALASGAAVLVGAEVRAPDRRFLERFGLTQDQVASCFAPYVAGLAPVDLGAGLPAYDRLPSAQMLAEGAGWDFALGQWGWQAQQIGAARLAGGWEFAPGIDPALISPPLRLDTARFQAIEVRMAAATAARDAQLFFLDEAGQADEARSLRWTLAPGTAAVTYRLPLQGQPGWTGIVTRLRLDPVSAGDGAWVRVEAVRLIP